MDSIDEILINKILLKIPNLVSKLRLRQVSIIWGDLIEEIFERENLWQVLCRNDYIYPWVYNIVEIIFQDKMRDWSRELLPIAWKKIYLFYNQWSSIITSINTNFKLSGFDEHTPFKEDAHSIDVQANKIAINIKKRKIIIVEVKDVVQESSIVSYEFHPRLLYETKFRSKKITRIKLWFTDTKKWILIVHMFRKSSGSKTLKYLDVSTGKELHNPFKTQRNIHNFTCASHRLFIATSELIYECKYTEPNGLVLGQHIFQFRNIFNRVEMEQLKVLEMTAKSTFGAMKVSLLIKTAADNVRVINFIVSRDKNDIFEQLHCDRDIRIRATESRFYMPMPGMVFIASESEMIINLWYNLTETHIGVDDDWERIVPLGAPAVFDVSRKNKMGSSTSLDERSSDPLSLSRMIGYEPLKITSMFLFCNILFLGLQSGDIHMYIADSLKSFIRNDFYKFLKRKLQVSKYPIIDINIIVRYGTFFMIATTPKAIYINHLIREDDF